MSVVKALEAELTADWADIEHLSEFRVIATERALDDIRQPTALIRRKTIGNTAAAPSSHSDVGVLLTLIAPYTDLDKAADLLDIAVPAAREYLRTRYQNERAECVGYSGERIAYDIPLTIIAANAPLTPVEEA